MVLVLTVIWTAQEEWDISASSLNVIYETPYTYSILADANLLTDTGFVPLLYDTLSIRRAIVSGDSIFFLTSDMESPLIVYLMKESTVVKVPVRGAFSDYSPSTGILLSPISLMGSHSFILRDTLTPVEMYGVRVVSFSDSILYVDRYGVLRFASGKVILGGVRDVLPYGKHLLILTSGSVLLMDGNFQVSKSLPRTFHLASGFNWMGSNGNFLLSSERQVYLWEIGTNSLRALFEVDDSITCISPVDYDGDGTMDILVSTTSRLFLYSNPMASSGENVEKVMIREYGYPSTCGGLYGMKLMRKIAEDGMVKLKTRYAPDGWIVSFRAPEGERARIRVINSRGITVFSREFKTVKGRNTVEIRDGFQTGTYTIVVEGETFRGRRTVIWKGR